MPWQSLLRCIKLCKKPLLEQRRRLDICQICHSKFVILIKRSTVHILNMHLLQAHNHLRTTGAYLEHENMCNIIQEQICPFLEITSSFIYASCTEKWRWGIKHRHGSKRCNSISVCLWTAGHPKFAKSRLLGMKWKNGGSQKNVYVTHNQRSLIISLHS